MLRWRGHGGSAFAGFGSLRFNWRLPGLPASSFTAVGFGFRPGMVIPPLVSFRGHARVATLPVLVAKVGNFAHPLPPGTLDRRLSGLTCAADGLQILSVVTAAVRARHDVIHLSLWPAAAAAEDVIPQPL